MSTSDVQERTSDLIIADAESRTAPVTLGRRFDHALRCIVLLESL